MVPDVAWAGFQWPNSDRDDAEEAYLPCTHTSSGNSGRFTVHKLINTSLPLMCLFHTAKTLTSNGEATPRAASQHIRSGLCTMLQGEKSLCGPDWRRLREVSKPYRRRLGEIKPKVDLLSDVSGSKDNVRHQSPSESVFSKTAKWVCRLRSWRAKSRLSHQCCIQSSGPREYRLIQLHQHLGGIWGLSI